MYPPPPPPPPLRWQAWMPLLMELAKRLGSNEADLEIVSSSKYSVVYDSARNIVYDNFRYFVSPDDTAEDLLKESTPNKRRTAKNQAAAPKGRKKIKGSGRRT